MKKPKKNKFQDNLHDILSVFVGVLGFFALKALFENDNSKIISKKGRMILSDENVMSDINDKIKIQEDSRGELHHNEILIQS